MVTKKRVKDVYDEILRDNNWAPEQRTWSYAEHFANIDKEFHRIKRNKR